MNINSEKWGMQKEWKIKYSFFDTGHKGVTIAESNKTGNCREL